MAAAVAQLHLLQVFAQLFVHEQLQGVANAALGRELFALKTLLARISSAPP
jgi:hypothetical protein